MSEFALPLAPRDRGWLELRERLARAARDLHFSAVASDTASGPTLLMIAGNLAGLALSIPMHPAPPQAMSDGSGGLVDASTLFATQVLQRDMQPGDGATDVGEGK